MLLSTGGGKGGRWSQALLRARIRSARDGGEGTQAAPHPTSATSMFPVFHGASLFMRIAGIAALGGTATPEMVLEDSALPGWDAGRGVGGLGRRVCILRMGVSLLPPDSAVTPEGSSAPHVLNESLVLITELHEDSSMLKQVDLGPCEKGIIQTCICKIGKGMQGIRGVLTVEDIGSRENAMLQHSGCQFELS